MASAAEDLDFYGRPSPSTEARWRAIQIAMRQFPDQALPELLSDFVRALGEGLNGGKPDAMAEFLDDWYRRALFAMAQEHRPEDAIITAEDWNKLPDRAFQ